MERSSKRTNLKQWQLSELPLTRSWTEQKMKDCIFCQIISGNEEASIVYEDEHFLALMDAYPLTKGHCLVIPKRHYERLDELNAKTRA
ncbi:HIT family protein, partial [Oleiphilus sp. HI0128]|uniref:HIT family protein n=1 Tax=Oleiphilus sp. HI0128 TaxID=1822267 RepID=UPI0035165AE2